MAHVSDHSKHHQVYMDFKFTGKCNYIKLPSQYLWNNTSLQKHLLLFLALQSLADHKPKTTAIHDLGLVTYASIFLHLQIIVHAGLSTLFPSGFRLPIKLFGFLNTARHTNLLGPQLSTVKE
jgi:hypothetical protein